MARLGISVALCTYRGERYLREQLDSIAWQTRLPDELVVFDDNSSDGTLAIIKEFTTVAPFPVRWGKNEKNLGSTKNFQQAITQCSGDIIALSDQDDVWHTDKLRLMEELYLTSPEVGGVFSNGAVVSHVLSPLGYTLWDSFRFTERDRNRFSRGKEFEILLNHNVVTGATLSFRSSLKDLLVPIPEEWVHDSWIAIIISICSSLLYIDQCLIDYRQHDSQQIGGMKRDLAAARAIAGTVDNYCAQILQYKLLVDHLHKLNPSTAGHWHGKLLEKITHLETRTAMYKCRGVSRASMAARELLMGRYHKYSNGWMSLAKDLFLIY